MPEVAANKRTVQDFIEVVWRQGDLAALPRFWTEDCQNHAAPAGVDHGMAALKIYHAQFAAAFDAFSDSHIEIVQQVAEGDRVVTQMVTSARHTAPFQGLQATNRTVHLATIRIDRLFGGKIDEHWSVADMAGLMQQLHG